MKHSDEGYYYRIGHGGQPSDRLSVCPSAPMAVGWVGVRYISWPAPASPPPPPQPANGVRTNCRESLPRRAYLAGQRSVQDDI